MAPLEDLERIAFEAKEYADDKADAGGKKYKAIDRFLNSWFKRSNELKESQNDRKHNDRLLNYFLEQTKDLKKHD